MRIGFVTRLLHVYVGGGGVKEGGWGGCRVLNNIVTEGFVEWNIKVPFFAFQI